MAGAGKYMTYSRSLAVPYSVDTLRQPAAAGRSAAAAVQPFAAAEICGQT